MNRAHSRAVRGAAFLLGALLATVAMRATSGRVLRVGVEANHLPFSNVRGEGFENKLAELIARELSAQLEWIWLQPRRSSARDSLESGRADLVVGVPFGSEGIATTRPYYTSTYVFVYRRGALPVDSFDDPMLRILRIGVTMVGDDFATTPSAHALMARGCVENIRGYPMPADYAAENQSAEIIRAVARGDIDVAVAWGPLAGYFARRQSPVLEIAPVSPERDGPERSFVLRIAMGVRKGNDVLRRELDDVIERRREDIEAILDLYGVPRADVTHAAAFEVLSVPRPH